MGYFKTLKLGKTYQEYNQQLFKAFFANIKNENQVDDNSKHDLKIFEPKNSRTNGILDTLHRPFSENGIKHKEYFLKIRKQLFNKEWEIIYNGRRKNI